MTILPISWFSKSKKVDSSIADFSRQLPRRSFLCKITFTDGLEIERSNCGASPAQAADGFRSWTFDVKNDSSLFVFGHQISKVEIIKEIV